MAIQQSRDTAALGPRKREAPGPRGPLPVDSEAGLQDRASLWPTETSTTVPV